MPFNSPFMSLTFSRYVRFIFHVCPVLSLRVISLHLQSCRFVSPHSPCTPLLSCLSLACPFSSPLLPFHFPLLSCHVDFLFPSLISLHFLAFPLCSPRFPALPKISRKQHGFSSVFAIRTSKNTEFCQIFGKRRQEPQTSKEPAGGIEPGTLVLRLVERHWGGGGWEGCTYQASGGGGLGGVVILYPLLGVRHTEQCWRIRDLERQASSLGGARFRPPAPLSHPPPPPPPPRRCWPPRSEEANSDGDGMTIETMPRNHFGKGYPAASNPFVWQGFFFADALVLTKGKAALKATAGKWLTFQDVSFCNDA